MKLKISEKIGKNYNDWWTSKKRYTVCKGGRASKKSVTTAIWLITNIMKYPEANALVIRRYSNTHRDSTLAQLQWAIQHLGVQEYWRVTTSPMEVVYLPTGQKIIFKGFDDATKITSLTVKTGYMCWCWIEEAFEISNEQDFDKLDFSFRGRLPEGLFFRFLITFNPWSEKHWLKRRFFDSVNENVFTKTTCYLDNEFLSEQDIALFEDMKKNKPKRYKVEGLGDWGISEGLVYENWVIERFKPQELFKDPDEKLIIGLDFGYVNSKTALIVATVNVEAKTIHIFDEFYNTGIRNIDIAEMLKVRGYQKQVIIADSAEPKSIADLKAYGITRIKEAKKGKDSVLNGISYIQEFEIIVHPKCTNTVIELSNYRWDTKDGKILNEPVKDFDHLLDALRYGIQSVKKAKVVTKNVRKVLGI